MGSISEGKTGGKHAHVLVIPLTTHGHIHPTLRVTKEIARHGVTLTFLSYGAIVSGLESLTDSFKAEGLDIRFASLPNPAVLENAGPRETSRKLENAFKPFLEKLLQDKQSGVLAYTSIFSDMFLNWTQDVADQLQIPRYLFVTSGAIFARFMQHTVHLQSEYGFQISESGSIVEFDEKIKIPGLPPISLHETPLSFKIAYYDFYERSERVWQAAGVAINSFTALEEEVLEAWRTAKAPEFGKVPKTYLIGPLISSGATVPNPTVQRGLDESADRSLLWLDSQPACSVLYIAFGSVTLLSALQIRELALGLEASGQRFLWVLPQPKGGSSTPEGKTQSVTDVLPPGFEARIGDRGYIVTGWAPQVQILAHPSTAGFLTHSGWNSSLESLTKGVPMLSWPQGAEQHLNCRSMVDDLKLAEQIRTGRENILEKKEVERAVRLLMVEAEGEVIRSRVKEMQKKALEALVEGGLQAMAFEELAKDLGTVDPI